MSLLMFTLTNLLWSIFGFPMSRRNASPLPRTSLEDVPGERGEGRGPGRDKSKTHLGQLCNPGKVGGNIEDMMMRVMVCTFQ